MVVSSQIRPIVTNRILAGLSLSDFDCIRPFLEPVVLKERSVLHEPNKPIDHVTFIETGIVSLRTLAIGSVLETSDGGLLRSRRGIDCSGCRDIFASVSCAGSRIRVEDS
jgi:hypothetical protein